MKTAEIFLIHIFTRREGHKRVCSLDAMCSIFIHQRTVFKYLMQVTIYFGERILTIKLMNNITLYWC